jgi:hypothetical protein
MFKQTTLAVSASLALATTAAWATDAPSEQAQHPLLHINCPFPSYCTIGLAHGVSLTSEPVFESGALSVKVHKASDQEYLVVSFDAGGADEQETSLILETDRGTHRFMVSGKPRQTGDWVMLD